MSGYEYEEAFIDALLFGEKPCPGCGRKLPRTRPYFSPDAKNRDGLTAACRDCRNARDVRRYAALKETA